MKLLETARFGQTEVGSFVLTIECQIGPRLEGNFVEEDDTQVPFERRTSMKLAQALQSTEVAIRESAASNKLDPFRTRSRDGVSANSCEALAELITAAEADRVRAAFSFAAWRPLRVPSVREVSFGADTALVLREAARQLRYETPLTDIDVTGPVVQLGSSAVTSGGEIVIQAVVEGKARSVHVALDADAYRVAVSAHGTSSPVRCSGDLLREGRSWWLRNARAFELPTELEDE